MTVAYPLRCVTSLSDFVASIESVLIYKLDDKSKELFPYIGMKDYYSDYCPQLKNEEPYAVIKV